MEISAQRCKNVPVYVAKGNMSKCVTRAHNYIDLHSHFSIAGNCIPYTYITSSRNRCDVSAGPSDGPGLQLAGVWQRRVEDDDCRHASDDTSSDQARGGTDPVRPAQRNTCGAHLPSYSVHLSLAVINWVLL